MCGSIVGFILFKAVWPENVNYSVISKSVLYLPSQPIITDIQLKYLSFIGLDEAFTVYVQNIMLMCLIEIIHCHIDKMMPYIRTLHY